MWGLSGKAHSKILPVISDCMPMMDELCKRSIKFINGCVVSKCAIVCRLARFALSVGRINLVGMQFSFQYGMGWILVK